MTVFMVTLQTVPVIDSAMKKAIEHYYPDDHFQVGDLTWLVSDNTSITPNEVSSVLGGGDIANTNDMGIYLISTFNGYWGYYDSSLWEWLRIRGL